MGAVFSDEDETEEETPIVKEEGIKKLPDAELATLHQRSGNSSPINKIRIPSPTRESGDGSEMKDANESTSKAKPTKLIRLPSTNITLEKLPPIKPLNHDFGDLKPEAAKSPLVELPTSGQLNRNNVKKKEKEPKFVPYEPYKAAVTPLTTQPKTKLRSTSSSTSLKTLKEECESLKEEFIHDKQLIEAKDAEIEALKRQLAEKDKQLKIQTQVNSEVKRLLVASVGEDIEAKVDYLTQDKARLSADIRQFAARISRDFEEKEHLSVESELWKSKFLACSVVIDELARAKANLVHRDESYEHAARLLLHEHAVLWTTTMDIHGLLAAIVKALDPLGDQVNPIDTGSLLGLADDALRIGLRLRERLGSTSTADLKPVAQLATPAEEALKSILSTPVAVSVDEYASTALTGAAKTQFRKLGDKLNSPTGSFKSCTHCQGSVKNV